MAGSKIELNKADLAQVNSMLSDIKGGANLALARALNKGVTHGKTQAAKDIGAYLNLKAKRIKSDFDGTFKAKKTDLRAGIVAKGKPVGLINYGARERVGGYSVKVLKKGKREFLKHSFKAKVKGIEHLFWRTKYGGKRTGSKKRYAKYFGTLPKAHFKKLPLEKLDGPRIEDVFAKPGMLDTILKLTEDKIGDQLFTEAETILRRHA